MLWYIFLHETLKRHNIHRNVSLNIPFFVQALCIIHKQIEIPLKNVPHVKYAFTDWAHTYKHTFHQQLLTFYLKKIPSCESWAYIKYSVDVLQWQIEDHCVSSLWRPIRQIESRFSLAFYETVKKKGDKQILHFYNLLTNHLLKAFTTRNDNRKRNGRFYFPENFYKNSLSSWTSHQTFIQLKMIIRWSNHSDLTEYFIAPMIQSSFFYWGIFRNYIHEKIGSTIWLYLQFKVKHGIWTPFEMLIEEQ